MMGNDLRSAIADAGMHRTVDTRRLFVRQFLEVVRQDQRGSGPPCQGNPHRPVNEVADLCRHSSLMDELAGNILEQRRQVDLLLVVAADCRARLLADDGKDRLVIHARIVETGDQVGCARPGRGDADAKLTAELGVSRRHERGHFFVPRLNELDLVFSPGQRSEDAIDAVAGIAEHSSHAPAVEPRHQEVADSFGHDGTPITQAKHEPP